MAIQSGLEFEKSIISVEITTSFQIARISTFFLYLHVSYMKKILFSVPTICSKPHVNIMKNVRQRGC